MCVTHMLIAQWAKFLSECKHQCKPNMCAVLHQPTNTLNISLKPRTMIERLQARQFILDVYDVQVGDYRER